MHDLKAAAGMVRRHWKTPDDFLLNAPMHTVLAAQALEALAWQEEKGAWVSLDGDVWVCRWYDERLSQHTYVADTPLGAILAAMEGEEKDGL